MEITTNIAYLAGLSMAAERLVEIIRGLSFFNFPKETPPHATVASAEKETTRVAKINMLAVVTGVITAAAAFWIGVLPVAKTWAEVCVYGVLAGAGSGFWNAVLAYLMQLKNVLPTPTVVVEGKAIGAAAGRY